MKGLRVLIWLCLAYSTLAVWAIGDEALEGLLSDRKNSLFLYDLQIVSHRGDQLENSWINPVIVRYGKDFTTQFDDGVVGTKRFTVSIDQPIFRSGGIYYGIKYAQAQTHANKLAIEELKRQTIIRALTVLFRIKRAELQIKRQKLIIQNDRDDVAQKRELYDAGMLDGGFLDQAILKKNQDEARLHEIELALVDLYEQFAKLSDKDPKSVRLPCLKLLDKSRFKNQSITLKKRKLRAQEKRYYAKMQSAKYLPTISVNARYVDEDINPLYGRFGGVSGRYYTYGIGISIPLDFNMVDDLQAVKLESLKAQAEVEEEEKALEEYYQKVLKRLKIIDRKIALAQKDKKLYRRLYHRTKDMVKAGQKTRYDARIMRRSIEAKQIEEQMYQLDKQIELLGLYGKTNEAI